MTASSVSRKRIAHSDLLASIYATSPVVTQHLVAIAELASRAVRPIRLGHIGYPIGVMLGLQFRYDHTGRLPSTIGEQHSIFPFIAA